MFKSKDAPLSEGGKNAAGGRGCLVLFGSVFFIAGMAVITFGAVLPAYNVVRSQQWVETPCTIVSSYVESHSDSDGTTYSIEITYTYTFDGQTFTSDRYDFLDVSSSGRSGKEDAVAQYPEGSQRTCYVDPSAPGEAVLNRGFRWSYLFIGGFGSIFAVVGGGIMAAGAFSGRGDRGKLKSTWRDENAAVAHAGELTMKPGSSRVAAVIGVTIFALIWNGIIFGIFFGADMDGFERLFMVPFILVGLAAIGGVIYFFLAMFNPEFVITIDPGTPHPGQRLHIQWHCEGSVQRIRSFKITVRGQESATYRRGTDTVTEKETFMETVMLETNDFKTMRSGQADFEFPDFAMHTFTASNNKIIWDIQVHGDIARWPDVKDEYEITVIPKPLD